jgi:hypothetical protein
MMSLKFKFLISLLLGLIFTAISHAQTTRPPGFVEDITDLVPLEGGLVYILAAALGHGSRKLFKRTKRDRTFE